jgi:hypothetical protein
MIGMVAGPGGAGQAWRGPAQVAATPGPIGPLGGAQPALAWADMAPMSSSSALRVDAPASPLAGPTARPSLQHLGERYDRALRQVGRLWRPAIAAVAEPVTTIDPARVYLVARGLGEALAGAACAAAVGVALAPLAQSDDATSRRVVALELARWRRDRVSLMTARPAIWPRPRDADAGTRPVVEAMRDQLWGRVELERPAVIELLAACSGRLANGAGCDDTLPARVTSELRRYLDEGCAALQLALAPVAGARPSVAWQTWYELAVGERRARTEPLPTELAESGFVLRVG